MVSIQLFPTVVRFAVIASLAVVPFACGSGEPEGGGRGSGGTDGGGGGPISAPAGGTGGIDPNIISAPPTENCGDGVRDDDEACDDGNRESDDGCGGNCRYIEPGYICPTEGELCRRFARCGDGVLVSPEQCDDGNTDAGDGCSPSCKFEIGYTCSGSPSTCEPTTCGDSVVEGAETCDDGNAVPFDGCSEICQAEPSCTKDGCTSRCGDGLVLGEEECDDGNTLDGDGCSSSCKVEAGYTCDQGSPCEDVGGHCALRLPVVYRDFKADHSDFGLGSGCDGTFLDIPQPDLNAAGKPVLNTAPPGACIESSTSFAEWYTDVSGTNRTIVDSILLFPNGSGGYVNRHGPNGEKWAGPPTYSVRWCGPTAVACMPSPGAPHHFTGCDFDPATETCWTSNRPNGCCSDCSCAGSMTEHLHDGTPLFFPIDDHPDAFDDPRHPAKLPEPVYGASGWPDEPGGALHNFFFTSEITYWFQYEAGSTANLTFVGDDDVWVFVNRRLAVDLGGVHVPIEGSVAILADGSIARVSDGTPLPAETVTDFGMSDGGVYEIKVFHAERKRDGSSFQLTLSGFNTSRSECTPTCGDGIIAAGEECDDGTENNTGGYNRCNPDCTLSGYCGDGIKQDHEECDDADPNAPASCRGCQIVIVR